MSPESYKDLLDAISFDSKKLLDALGALSVALSRLQEGGIIGKREIIIPDDNYGELVTVAVDDDSTIPVQFLLREQEKFFLGSAVIALCRAVMDEQKLSFALDSYLIDPATTKQEKYDPTQLLVSLSNIGVD